MDETPGRNSVEAFLAVRDELAALDAQLYEARFRAAVRAVAREIVIRWLLAPASYEEKLAMIRLEPAPDPIAVARSLSVLVGRS